MKTKKLTPRNLAPVKREVSTVSRDGNSIAPLEGLWGDQGVTPFAGDDSE